MQRNVGYRSEPENEIGVHLTIRFVCKGQQVSHSDFDETSLTEGVP